MSLGLSQEEYWEMTPYQLELVQEAENRKWELEALSHLLATRNSLLATHYYYIANPNIGKDVGGKTLLILSIIAFKRLKTNPFKFF